jgi:chemotaxis protein MotB
LREVLAGRPGFAIIGDRFVFQSEVLFGSGSADLGAPGKEGLRAFANVLKDVMKRIPADLPWILQVDGHTDSIPIQTPRFPSNWELSAARAIEVVNYLVTEGIPATRLSATGYGEFQPIDSRDDEIAYRRNRRIELKLTQR